MWKDFVDYLTYELWNLEGHLGEAVNFFIYDTIKIFFLLIVIIYVVSFLRSFFPVEKIRDYLSGKHKIV